MSGFDPVRMTRYYKARKMVDNLRKNRELPKDHEGTGESNQTTKGDSHSKEQAVFKHGDDAQKTRAQDIKLAKRNYWRRMRSISALR